MKLTVFEFDKELNPVKGQEENEDKDDNSGSF